MVKIPPRLADTACVTFILLLAAFAVWASLTSPKPEIVSPAQSWHKETGGGGGSQGPLSRQWPERPDKREGSPHPPVPGP